MDNAHQLPFLTVLTYADKEYVGIVQNTAQKMLSMYSLNDIPTQEARAMFLELGDKWWWETSRQVPINMFYGEYFFYFKQFLKTFILKDVTIVSGPVISVDTIVQKRSKRRRISLVKE